MKGLKVHTGEGCTESVPVNVFLVVFSMVLDLIKVILVSLPVFVVTIVRIIIPPKPKDVSGQTVLITGAGNGLGKAMAHEFASRGSNVVVADVDLMAAEQTCEELRRKQVSAYAFQVDVSSYEQVEALAASVHKNVGPVDILINNAGVVSFNFLRDANEDIINLMIDVNVKGTIWVTKHFLEKMTERRRGHIVFISSLAGIHALPWATVYSTSKHAVNGFMSAVTESLRLQGYGDQIRTTCVNPYYIATRKDIVDFLEKPRFEVLSTEHTAQTIVQRILQNETIITVPRFFGFGIRLMQLFPVRIQQIMRDYILREYELNSL